MRLTFKSTFSLAAVFLVALSMQNCSSVKPIDKVGLEGNWVLRSLKGEEAKAVFEETLPSLEFNFKDNMLSGSGGCNRFSGAFTLTGKNGFSAPNLAATMMACMSSNKEPEFFATLSAPDLTLSLEKDGTLAFKQGKATVLVFQKDQTAVKTTTVTALTPDVLTGKWELVFIKDGDPATLFAAGNFPFLEFTTEGNVSGKSGCNNYRSTYKLENNTITFQQGISTKMACPNLEGENLFLANLTNPLQATLNTDTLTLSDGGNVVMKLIRK